jgi:hypothetical protein
VLRRASDLRAVVKVALNIPSPYKWEIRCVGVKFEVHTLVTMTHARFWSVAL